MSRSEASRRKLRERMRRGGRHQSLMSILQPVQRGLVFRRVRRSAGAFCRPFKPSVVLTVINKHGRPFPRGCHAVPHSRSDWSICNARSVAKKCHCGAYQTGLYRRARKLEKGNGSCSCIWNCLWRSRQDLCQEIESPNWLWRTCVFTNHTFCRLCRAREIGESKAIFEIKSFQFPFFLRNDQCMMYDTWSYARSLHAPEIGICTLHTEKKLIELSWNTYLITTVWNTNNP